MQALCKHCASYVQARVIYVQARLLRIAKTMCFCYFGLSELSVSNFNELEVLGRNVFPDVLQANPRDQGISGSLYINVLCTYRALST